ncbi:MAG: DUF167 domain-containing protein [Acidimicrobiia bacterium]|nr:DUF167 domain-containing protein [Acidimicrobiia bacterium]
MAAPAEGDRANRAVIDLFAAVFGRTVQLAHGRTSRAKRLRIIGANQDFVERVLKALLEGDAAC